MSLGTVGDVMTTAHFGKVIRTKSERFGEHEYLVVNHPAEGSLCNRFRFVKLPHASVLFWESMRNDEVLEIREANL